LDKGESVAIKGDSAGDRLGEIWVKRKKVESIGQESTIEF